MYDYKLADTAPKRSGPVIYVRDRSPRCKFGNGFLSITEFIALSDKPVALFGTPGSGLSSVLRSVKSSSPHGRTLQVLKSIPEQPFVIDNFLNNDGESRVIVGCARSTALKLAQHGFEARELEMVALDHEGRWLIPGDPRTLYRLPLADAAWFGRLGPSLDAYYSRMLTTLIGDSPSGSVVGNAMPEAITLLGEIALDSLTGLTDRGSLVKRCMARTDAKKRKIVDLISNSTIFREHQYAGIKFRHSPLRNWLACNAAIYNRRSVTSRHLSSLSELFKEPSLLENDAFRRYVHLNYAILSQIIPTLENNPSLEAGKKDGQSDVLDFVTARESKVLRAPVSVAEYRAFVASGGYRMPQFWRVTPQWEEPLEWKRQLDNHARPVVGISWWEAHAYCEWLTASTGRFSCLLSEKAWNDASGALVQRYPWGNAEPASELLNFDQYIGHSTRPEMHKPGSGPFGHLDLSGNVWEWGGETKDDLKVVRGGGWFTNRNFVSGDYRYHFNSYNRFNDLGFRVEQPQGAWHAI